MQSVDEFTPSTTEPVFGSGLISQTKSQSSTNNDTSDSEKVIPPSEPVVNGQNEPTVTKMTSNENITNGTEEPINEDSGTGDSTAVLVNGDNEKPMVEIDNEEKPAEESVPETEKPMEVEPTVPSTAPEPEPVSSTPVDTVTEGSSTAVDTAPPPVVEAPPPTAMEVNDNVPEAPVATESETAEVKSKSPRGKAKAPVATTPPTRQSARGRKPASSSNAEESQPTDETVSTTQNESSSSSPQRAKRQAATIAKDAITASNQANSTDDFNDQDMVPSDDNEDPDHKASPSTGRKRAAPKTTPNAAKKAKGSVTSTNDVDNEAAANEGETVETPPRKARTSANKKTPEQPSEEYVRKLRPRK